MLHYFWRVSYETCFQPLVAKLSPNSILISFSRRWCPRLSNPLMFIISDSGAYSIILASSISAAPSRLNHSCAIWSSWKTSFQDFILSNCMPLQGFLVQLVCAVIDMWPVLILTYVGACIIYKFYHIWIGRRPAVFFFPCGVMYVDYIFLCPSSPLFYLLYPLSTCSISSCIFYLISWVSVLYFSCTSSVLLIQYPKNFSMWIYGPMMRSTSDWPLDFFLVVCITVYLHMLSSGWSIFLYYYLDHCTLSSIRCTRRYVHILTLSRHHDETPYVSRGQGTRLKFSCFLSAVKLPVLKIYNGFLDIRNVPTSQCCPLKPLSISALFSGFLAV